MANAIIALEKVKEPTKSLFDPTGLWSLVYGLWTVSIERGVIIRCHRVGLGLGFPHSLCICKRPDSSW